MQFLSEKTIDRILLPDTLGVLTPDLTKKFIKDIVNGTIEREELINTEINNHLDQDLKIKNMDKVFQIIIKSAIFEFLYKPNTSIKIIINEYLKASNFFINDSQTKYLNALLDKISKKIRINNE